jgi:hypothetical protein
MWNIIYGQNILILILRKAVQIVIDIHLAGIMIFTEMSVIMNVKMKFNIHITRKIERIEIFSV